MPYSIMAVDPGGRSGYVIVAFPTKSSLQMQLGASGAHEIVQRLKTVGPPAFYCGHVEGLYTKQSVRLNHMVRKFNIDHLIIEDFRLIPGGIQHTKTQDLLAPVKVGWGLAALVEAKDVAVTEVHWQVPSDMGVINDQRLRQWGLWVSQKDVRAAMKHLLVYLRRQ